MAPCLERHKFPSATFGIIEYDSQQYPNNAAVRSPYHPLRTNQTTWLPIFYVFSKRSNATNGNQNCDDFGYIMYIDRGPILN